MGALARNCLNSLKLDRQTNSQKTTKEILKAKLNFIAAFMLSKLRIVRVATLPKKFETLVRYL